MASLKELSASSDANELWPLYKNEHNKNYEAGEDKERFEIFKNSIATIVEHNEKYKRGEVTYSMGLNHFADQKPEERACCGGKKK